MTISCQGIYPCCSIGFSRMIFNTCHSIIWIRIYGGCLECCWYCAVMPRAVIYLRTFERSTRRPPKGLQSVYCGCKTYNWVYTINYCSIRWKLFNALVGKVCWIIAARGGSSVASVGRCPCSIIQLWWRIGARGVIDKHPSEIYKL